jgi:uncharacterized LabA/DUF88 family protein
MSGKNRIFAFIDASNVWQAQKTKGRFFDYAKLKDFLTKKFDASSVEMFYYTAYPKEGTRDYDLDGRHKFFTYLKKGLGMTVRKKELKRITVTSPTGETIEEKGNMDVEITIDVVTHMKRYDTAVLFSGDYDFLALTSYVRNGGKKVYVFSSKNNISQELKTGTDGYIDVLDITEDIWGRELKHRQQLK